MRTPVVKRQTSPESGFLLFFRRVDPGVVILWQRVLTWFRSAGAAISGLHHTLLAGLPPGHWRWPRAVVRLSAPSKHRCPLLPSYAQARRPISRRQCAPGAGEGQPTGTMRHLRPRDRSASTRPITRAGAGHRASGLMGVRRRTGGSMAEHGCQARPSCPSAAAGAPAPLPARWRTRVRSNPTSRCNREETARASVGASTVSAWPGPCFVSKRARDFWPAGLVRRQRTAAAEQAHCKTPCRSSGQRCHPASPPLPWRM